MARDLHQEITTRIVARLKEGVVPWKQPWSGKGHGVMPRNAVTQRAYSGANVMLLWSRAQESGFRNPRYGSRSSKRLNSAEMCARAKRAKP